MAYVEVDGVKWVRGEIARKRGAEPTAAPMGRRRPVAPRLAIMDERKRQGARPARPRPVLFSAGPGANDHADQCRALGRGRRCSPASPTRRNGWDKKKKRTRRRPSPLPRPRGSPPSSCLSLPSLSPRPAPPQQLEEEIQDDLKWSIRVNAVLHSGKSDFQSVELVDSGPFGKVKRETERKGWKQKERAHSRTRSLSPRLPLSHNTQPTPRSLPPAT